MAPLAAIAVVNRPVMRPTRSGKSRLMIAGKSVADRHAEADEPRAGEQHRRATGDARGDVRGDGEGHQEEAGLMTEPAGQHRCKRRAGGHAQWSERS